MGIQQIITLFVFQIVTFAITTVWYRLLTVAVSNNLWKCGDSYSLCR